MASSTQPSPSLIRAYSDDSVDFEDNVNRLLHDPHINFFDNLITNTNEENLRDAVIYYSEVSKNNQILYNPSRITIQKTNYIEDLFDCIETKPKTQRINSLLLHNIIQDLFNRYHSVISEKLVTNGKHYDEITEFKKYVDYVFEFIGNQYDENVCVFNSHGYLNEIFIIHSVLACVVYFNFVKDNPLNEKGDIKVHMPQKSIVPEEGIKNILDLVNAEREKKGLFGGKKLYNRKTRKRRKMYKPRKEVTNHKRNKGNKRNKINRSNKKTNKKTKSIKSTNKKSSITSKHTKKRKY
jgi:hypothetical protein